MTMAICSRFLPKRSFIVICLFVLLLLARATATNWPAVRRSYGEIALRAGLPFARGHNIDKALKVQAFVIRGGSTFPKASELASGAVDWCNNLGAPAALVAGAVIATMYEGVRSEELQVSKNDAHWIAVAKKFEKMMLMFSFALEVMSIFVTTVTATSLMSVSVENLAVTESSNTPLSFLRTHFEFEFLTSRMCFLGGLIAWLGAIALGHGIPTNEASTSARRLNLFMSTGLASLIVLMISFLNRHLQFYPNFWAMTRIWLTELYYRDIAHWPPPPLALVFIPLLLRTGQLAWQSLTEHDQVEAEKSPMKRPGKK